MMNTSCYIPEFWQHELECNNVISRPNRIRIHKSATWDGNTLNWNQGSTPMALTVHGWTQEDKQKLSDRLGTMEADFLEIQING